MSDIVVPKIGPVSGMLLCPPAEGTWSTGQPLALWARSQIYLVPFGHMGFGDRERHWGIWYG